MAGPAVVIVAAIATAWIAVSSNDGLVTDDYYKKGLAVNQTLARTELAERLGLEVRARFTADGVEVKLDSIRRGEFSPPSSLLLSLSHPTRAGLDQTATMPLSDGRYSGNLRLPSAGHWLVIVEDEARTWRLMGNVVLPAAGEVVIGGASANGEQG
jgi:hypothetical protein